MPKLDPVLTDWLNHTVYPHLSHAQIFGDLPNFHLLKSGDFYADCPRCQRKGVFFGYADWHMGRCRSCRHVIGWFAKIRWPGYDDDRAIRMIAEMAGVSTGPFGERLDAPLPALTDLFRPIDSDDLT